MTRAIDPFEEFLRKKKVELLEQQYREQGSRAAPESATATEAPTPAASEEEVEQDARVQAEMDEFFESGQQAGVEIFQQMKELDDNKVEEIKDALSDVFEEDAARPSNSEDSETFVNFFQQVQDSFDGKPGVTPTPPPSLPQSPHTALEDAPAPEAKAPSAPAPVAPAPTARAPEAPVPNAPAPKPAPARPTAPPAFDPAPLPDLAATAAEVSTDAPVATPTESREGRINLAEILLSEMEDADDLGKRIEVLFRLVSRLVERSNMPESEIIEVLIKSDVEF